jgi:hypothetical protein
VQYLADGMIFEGAEGRAQSDERRKKAFFLFTDLQENITGGQAFHARFQQEDTGRLSAGEYRRRK